MQGRWGQQDGRGRAAYRACGDGSRGGSRGGEDKRLGSVAVGSDSSGIGVKMEARVGEAAVL